ncbi:DUF4287 domain-containing protein [Devosia sp.]|uniref:DUF4287 domain-containing protein n=1 Tax=Devosia sp. TaxID=1871048 RepID=UPI003263AF97
MTFQAYIDTIKQKTGLDPADFVRLAAEKGLGPDSKPMAIIGWLAADHGLGRGHGMAIVHVIQSTVTGGLKPAEERLDGLFVGGKAVWRPAFDGLLKTVSSFGEVGTAATDTYVSLLRGKGKFAIVQPSGKRLDIGIKRKGVEPTERFAAAGAWNSMVTHRVGITDAAQLDTELLDWLAAAYEAAK